MITHLMVTVREESIYCKNTDRPEHADGSDRINLFTCTIAASVRIDAITN